jgi:hypothetical protein
MAEEKEKKEAIPITTALQTTRKISAGNGLAARRQAAPQVETDLSKFPNRISLIFDDSGSMSGSPIESAKLAVQAFLQSINPNDTAISIIPLNATGQPLGNNIGQLMTYTIGIKLAGATPIFSNLTRVITRKDSNRIILFSDGGPTDSVMCSNQGQGTATDSLITITTELKNANIPVDTCFIGSSADKLAITFMRDLAELTGGIALIFTGPETFKAGLKYLSPRTRHLLANAELKERIQRGESI